MCTGCDSKTKRSKRRGGVRYEIRFADEKSSLARPERFGNCESFQSAVKTTLVWTTISDAPIVKSKIDDCCLLFGARATEVLV